MLKVINNAEYNVMYALLNKLLDDEVITFADWYNSLLKLMERNNIPYAPHK